MIGPFKRLSIHSILSTYKSGIECGERNPAFRNVEFIAKTLGISLAELMKGL